MSRNQIWIGLALGLGLALARPSAPDEGTRTRGALPPHGALLSDVGGALDDVVIHYVPAAVGVVETAYRDLLRQLPSHVTVHVVCPSAAAYEDFLARVGRVDCRLELVPAGHAMTTWSRDRWLAFAPPEGGGPTLVLTPRAEDGEASWPARAGDRQIGRDLARFSDGRVVTRRSDLFFDGGDFVADEDTVFVSPRVALRNVGRTVATREDLLNRLAALFRRDVVLLAEAPDHHLGMILMLAGGRRVIVGDPSLARSRIGPSRPAPFPAADLTDGAQASFDAVARRCVAEGYVVERMPVVPGLDGRTYLTWVNALLDESAEAPVVFMPVFRHAESLNDAAEARWRRMGYEVRRVDCTDAYVHFGSLRCLVNVLRRTEPEQ